MLLCVFFSFSGEIERAQKHHITKCFELLKNSENSFMGLISNHEIDDKKTSKALQCLGKKALLRSGI